MRINQNISAMNTYSRLNSANAAKSKSLAKLSSGLRINRAGDDAAGLAISEKMRGQVGGLKQATRNAQDGISLIQTAEGALSETHSILNRMRELAVQSSSDTNTADDRKEIQKEMNQLTSEINRIGNTTEFNTQKVLKGGAESTGKMGSVTSTAYAAEVPGEVTSPEVPGSSAAIGTVTNTIGGAGGTSDVKATITDGGITVTAKENGPAYNGYTFTVAQADAADEGIAIDHDTKSIVISFDVANEGSTKDISSLDVTATGMDSTGVSGTDAFVFSGTATLATTGTTGTTASGDLVTGGVEGTTSFEITTAMEVGDKITVGGTTFEVTADGIGATGGNTAIDLSSASTAADQAGAIRDHFDTGGAGAGTFSVTGTGANITLTQSAAGTGNTGVAVLEPRATVEATTGPLTPAVSASVAFDITTAFDEGDTLTVGGTTFEFTADGTGAATGNTGLSLSTLTTAEDQAGAIRTALEGGSFTVTGSGANVTLTQTVAGTGVLDNPTSAGAGGKDFSATLQIGANQSQSFEVKVGDMRATALGLSGATGGQVEGVAGASFAAADVLTDLSNSTVDEYGLDLSTNEKASAAITVVDKAIASVSAERSKLGSVQNRLEHTINNLTATAENLSEAESRIRDVDMAEEMMQFTKNNILSQAATSMLAQANQMPQSVLQLLQ